MDKEERRAKIDQSDSKSNTSVLNPDNIFIDFDQTEVMNSFETNKFKVDL